MDLSGASCFTCKKDLTDILLKVKKYDHRCFYCRKVQCRPCDDRNTLLNWYSKDGDEDGTDVYACEKCVRKQTKKGVVLVK